MAGEPVAGNVYLFDHNHSDPDDYDTTAETLGTTYCVFSYHDSYKSSKTHTGRKITKGYSHSDYVFKQVLSEQEYTIKGKATFAQAEYIEEFDGRLEEANKSTTQANLVICRATSTWKHFYKGNTAYHTLPCEIVKLSIDWGTDQSQICEISLTVKAVW